MMKYKRIRIVRPEIDVQIKGIRGFLLLIFVAALHSVKFRKLVPIIEDCKCKPIYIIGIAKYNLRRMTDEV